MRSYSHKHKLLVRQPHQSVPTTNGQQRLPTLRANHIAKPNVRGHRADGKAYTTRSLLQGSGCAALLGVTGS